MESRQYRTFIFVHVIFFLYNLSLLRYVIFSILIGNMVGRKRVEKKAKAIRDTYPRWSWKRISQRYISHHITRHRKAYKALMIGKYVYVSWEIVTLVVYLLLPRYVPLEEAMRFERTKEFITFGVTVFIWYGLYRDKVTSRFE